MTRVPFWHFLCLVAQQQQQQLQQQQQQRRKESRFGFFEEQIMNLNERTARRVGTSWINRFNWSNEASSDFGIIAIIIIIIIVFIVLEIIITWYIYHYYYCYCCYIDVMIVMAMIMIILFVYLGCCNEMVFWWVLNNVYEDQCVKRLFVTCLSFCYGYNFFVDVRVCGCVGGCNGGGAVESNCASVSSVSLLGRLNLGRNDRSLAFKAINQRQRRGWGPVTPGG